MSDNYIKVTVTGNKSKSVSVKSTELKNQITAGADMSIYYSNKAKEWAISDKLVDNEDYSSKYHANLAKGYTEEGALQIAEITTLREQTLADIETEKQNVIDMGTDQINQVTTISNTAISDIETSKTNALSDIDSAKTIVLEDISTQETQTINNIRKTADVELDKIVGTGIDSRANIDLSNLSEVGGKHFLGKSQITNCITEIPQRIKADVVDGTLTVYAGTVAIVPYGTTDRTSEFPIGSTFIHENFKVVDTQFADDKFFVWVEVQNDTQHVIQISDTNERLLEIDLTINSFRAVNNTISSTTQYTGTANCTNYRTDLNLVQYHQSGALQNSVVSLPILKVKADGTYVYGSITQTFNGMGYIGLSNWLDKDIKCLIPNYRNDDGTLKNTEWTNSKFSVFTNNGGFANRTNQAMFLDINDNVYFPLGTSFSTDEYKNVNYNLVFDTNLNKYFYRSTDKYVPKEGLVVGFANFDANSNCTSFNPKQPFRAVDYSEYLNNIDGKWVTVNKTIFSNKTFDVGAYTTHNCKDILPNDGNVYECIFRCYWANGGKVAGAYLRSIDMNMDFTLGKVLWWNDTSRQVVLKSGGTYRFGNLTSSEVSITGCSLILTGYRKVR